MIEGCRRADRRAQEQLFRQLYGFAMAIAMRYAVDEQEAAGIMSAAFVKVFRHIHQHDPGKGSFHAWVKRIVINESLNHIKQRSRFSTRELEAAETPAISNDIIEKTDAAVIMNMIRRLPPATHAVFVLYAIEGFSHREVAEQLGISEGTSKWHLSEARKKLQQALTNSI